MQEAYQKVFDKMKLSKKGKERAKALFSEENERKGRSMERRKIIWRGAAAAACLALIVTANAVGLMQRQNRTEVPGNIAEETNSVLDKYFTVTAYAKELTKTGKVFQEKYSGSSNGFCGDKTDELSYNFEFPVEVKGENIDTVTYTIQEGAFCINHPKKKNIVVSGNKLEKLLNVPGRSAEDEREKKLTYLDEQYRSFTVKYDYQTDKKICVDIVGTSDAWSKEKKAQYKALHYDIVDSTVEEEKAVCDFLMKDMNITCMVTYKDGSTESKDIVLSNEIMRVSDVTDVAEEEKPEKDSRVVVTCFSIR